MDEWAMGCISCGQDTTESCDGDGRPLCWACWVLRGEWSEMLADMAGDELAAAN